MKTGVVSECELGSLSLLLVGKSRFLGVFSIGMFVARYGFLLILIPTEGNQSLANLRFKILKSSF
jgi:hypothetical protein